MNYRMIKYTLGWLLMFEAGFMLVPLITAAVYWESEFWSFLIVALMSLAIGGLMIIKKPKNTTLYSKEGLVIAALSWIVLSAVGALPFLFTGVLTNPIDAMFEAVSGFTTTGSSVFTSVEWLPKCILMWRSFMHWVGGMGVLVFMMAFLPLAGGQNMHIMKAESPGPDVAKFVPKVRETAFILYAIYFVLTAISFILFLISGMSCFDALNTAFATAGTGGFGFRDDSFASFTPAQQWLVTAFMLIFSINFNSYYLLLRRKWKDAINAEVRAFIIIVVVGITLISVNICLNMSEIGQFETVGDGIRHATFSLASLISTTGFATVDFNIWPAFSKVILMLILFIGACAGSTGGGFKVSRILILLKGVGNELTKLIHPRQVKPVTIDKRPVDKEVVRSVNSYIVAYICIFIVSVILVSIEGKDLVTTVTSVMTTMGNVGPGLELVGPAANFAHMSDLSKLVLSFNMIAGRLELFPMLILLSPATWKKS